MKICCITKDIYAGGAGKSLYVLLSRLASSHSIKVLSFSSDNNVPLTSSNIEHSTIKSGFYPFHFSSGARNPFFINYAAWIVRCMGLFSTVKKVKDFSPDLVLLNGFQALWYAPFIRKNKTRVVLFARELLNQDYQDSKFALKIIDKYIDCVIAITENEKDQLGAIKPAVHVVYNSFEGSFDEESFSGFHEQQEVKVGVFGTIQRTKGQYLIISLTEKYIDEIKSKRIKFYLYGGPSTFTTRDGGKEQLEELVIQKGLQDFIVFPGWVKDVSSEMKKMDIILRTDASGCPWGRDIIEAMSLGKPVIAAGSSTVFIKPRQTGLLFREKSIEEMAGCLFELVEDAKLRINLGRSAREFARTNFDPDKNARRVESIFEDVVGNS